METVRQGDILFIRLDKAPAKSIPLPSGIIAQGTATGHTHALRKSDRTKLVRSGELLYVVARSIAHIDHQEHGTVDLGPGTWEIRRQREETPEGFRQVKD